MRDINQTKLNSNQSADSDSNLFGEAAQPNRKSSIHASEHLISEYSPVKLDPRTETSYISPKSRD